MRAVLTAAILSFGLSVSLLHDSDAAVDQYCAGTPAGAVMTLPAPLDQWAELYCTEYGHVIAARDGWRWSLPGAYRAVFVPAQTGTDFPLTLGNTSYFTRIDMAEISPLDALPQRPAAARALPAGRYIGVDRATSDLFPRRWREWPLGHLVLP
jgi:hypothetical protein